MKNWIRRAHWPPYMILGYLISFPLNDFLFAGGFASIEKHFLIGLLIILSVMTLGGLALTTLPLVVATSIILLTNLSYFGTLRFLAKTGRLSNRQKTARATWVAIVIAVTAYLSAMSVIYR